MNGVTQSDVSHFLSCLEARDLDAAVADVLTLFDAGARVPGLAASLLTPAQAEVGRRWQSGEWTVAQEQHASAIVDACLSALGAAEAAVRGRGEQGWVVVGAVEDDWHALPARMIAESLRAGGWKVTFAGASASAERLCGSFGSEPPAAALFSCSVTSNLLGAARCADVLARAGVPVLVGGRAFGNDPARAERIGARWAAGPGDVAQAVGELRAAPEPRRRPVLQDGPWAKLLRSEAASAALTDLFLRWPRIASLDDAELARVRTHLELAIGTAAAGALVEADDLLAEFAVWLDVTVRAQGIDHPPTEHVIDAVACALGPDERWVKRQVNAAKERVMNAGGSPESDGVGLYAGEMPEAGGVPPERADGGDSPTQENQAAQPKPPSTSRRRLDDAAEAVRERARVATARLRAGAASLEGERGDDPLLRLRQQAEHLFADAKNRRTTDREVERSTDVAAPPSFEERADTSASAARMSQVLDAARAQAARLLDEAEREAARIRQLANDDAERIRAAADAAANEILEGAEAESLEWLAEAGRQVVCHLDEVQAESGRILAAARAEAARITADASRAQSEISARAAQVVQEAQQESERQLAQTAVTTSALVAKARSEAAAIVADAQLEKTRLAEETERLAAGAAELLELRLNEVEQARLEAMELRAAADAAIEADTRRLLGEAQADCDRIMAEAQAEAELVRREALRAQPAAAVDLRDPRADDADECVDTEPATTPAPRRRRFRG